MKRLNLSLLGGFTVTLDNQPLTQFRSAKSRGLLAFLAMQPDQDHSRAALATLLWGDLPETAAKTNLRVELSHLKKLLQTTDALAISRQTVRLDGTAVAVEAADLLHTIETFLSLPAETQQQRLPALAQAVSAYRGEFLVGFHLPDAPDFDDWQRQTQERLHTQVMQALTRLQQQYAALGQWAELAQAAQRQLALVPWLEDAHRRLIQALAAQGQRQAALDQYAQCRAVLQAELGIEPAPDTQALAQQIADGRSPASTPRPHNLPAQLTTFIGRDAETAELHALVRARRLVTLLGLGGVGKSRLAQAVAQRALPDFDDGVWFVPLAGIDPGPGAANRIALAIAAAIQFPITQTQEALAVLRDHLAGQRMLLVLDNWDHLIAAVEGVLGGLLAETAVHVLATSRLRLHAPDERVYPLEGLPTAAGVALFIDRARRLLPDFTREGAETAVPGAAGAIDDIAAICAQVRGLPLGIELAASWVEHFTVAEIGASLAEIAAAPQQAAILADRHHSLDAVLTYSWRLLSPGQQQILARLSLFQGGFDRAAAAAVAECGLSDLSILLGHSLVQRVAAGRYDLHPLVREFAARRRPPAAEAALRQRYRRHFLTTLVATDHLQRDALLPDYENVRQAWLFAAEAKDGELVETAVAHFGEFVARFGLVADGYRWLQTAVAAFEDDPDRRELIARLMHHQWRFSLSLHGREATVRLHRRLLTLTTDVRLRVDTLVDLANLHVEAGEWADADACFDEVEALAKTIDDPHVYVNAVEGRIHVNAIHFRGDFGQGLTRLESLLPILDAIPNPTTETEYLRSQVRSSIVTVGFRYGAYDVALRNARQNLAWARALDHQQELVAILLELALTELFAGLLPQAVAHNEEALARAREIGATDDVGLLQANHCMILRQCGELEAALAHGQAGAAILRELAQMRMLGQALNRSGHVQLALGQAAAAYETYGEALDVWAPLQHQNQYEAMAGRAAAALALDRREEAAQRVEDVLAFTAVYGVMGIVEPALLYWHVAQAQAELGQPAAAAATMETGRQWVQTIAARIAETAVRRAFLQRPDNVRLLGGEQ